MIPIAKPSLGEAEASAAAAAVRSGWVSQGNEVAEFEREFAAFVGAKHACCTSSCSTALHLALHVLGVGPGDEVITPSHSFIAASNMVRLCGASPVFVDIDPETFNLVPDRLQAAITKHTKLILPVHQMGIPCDMTPVVEIADQFGLPVIEDAACAIGSEYLTGNRWEYIGKPHGQVACFSFHPRKVMTTGEGGMLTTNDPKLDRQFRLLRQHGMSVSDLHRHRSNKIIFEKYVYTGYNYRMSDIQAAVGRVQLQRLPELLARRRLLAHRYDQAIENIDGLRLPTLPADVRTNYQSYPVYVCDDFPLDRDQLMRVLLERGVSTRRGIMNVHQEPAFNEYNEQVLSASVAARDRVLLLPLYHDLSRQEQDLVIDLLSAYAERKPMAGVAKQ